MPLTQAKIKKAPISALGTNCVLNLLCVKSMMLSREQSLVTRVVEIIEIEKNEDKD